MFTSMPSPEFRSQLFLSTANGPSSARIPLPQRVTVFLEITVNVVPSGLPVETLMPSPRQASTLQLVTVPVPTSWMPKSEQAATVSLIAVMPVPVADSPTPPLASVKLSMVTSLAVTVMQLPW
jgi:hypothetical protein